MSPSLSSLLLRQAQVRTQLVVDCAGLVRLIEELDDEIKGYDQWQKYPTEEYKTSVQQRFEEARQREAEEAARRAGSTSIASELPLRSLSRNASPRRYVQSSTDEEQLSLVHLQCALRAADFEAGVWRQRLSEMELADEREREEAKRLMEFELSKALKNIEDDREGMMGQLKDRDVAFEKMEAAYRALASERDVLQEAIVVAVKRLQDQRHPSNAVAAVIDAHTFEAAVKYLQAELNLLGDERKEFEATRSQVTRLSEMVTEQSMDLTSKAKEIESSRSELAHLSDSFKARDKELLEIRMHNRSLQDALEDQTAVLLAVRADCDRKQEVALDACRRFELSNAKCQNLEAALENATRKQAEASLEKEIQRERANCLEKLLEESRSSPERKVRLLDSLNCSGSQSLNSTGVPFDSFNDFYSTANSSPLTSPKSR